MWKLKRTSKSPKWPFIWWEMLIANENSSYEYFGFFFQFFSFYFLHFQSICIKNAFWMFAGESFDIFLPIFKTPHQKDAESQNFTFKSAFFTPKKQLGFKKMLPCIWGGLKTIPKTSGKSELLSESALSLCMLICVWTGKKVLIFFKCKTEMYFGQKAKKRT